MSDELRVHISRQDVHSLEVPPSFEATGPFDVRLINHGQSLHVHLHLDDALSTVAYIDAGNHYIEGESERVIRIDVDPESVDGNPLLGKLKVASAYGAETRWIDIEVAEPDDDDEGVRIDESLAKPKPEPDNSPLLENPEIPVLVIGAIALLIAGLTALLIDETMILIGAVVVLAGVLVGLFFIMQERL